MSPRRRLRGDDPDDALDESAVVLIVIPRAHIAKGRELATRVGVELGVLLIWTAERVDSRHAIIRRPSTED